MDSGGISPALSAGENTGVTLAAMIVHVERLTCVTVVSKNAIYRIKESP
jgi:hypothetical protein